MLVGSMISDVETVVDEILPEETPVKPVFLIAGGEGEIIRFEANGDIYIKGRAVTNDMEVVEGFREFLRQASLID